MGKLINRSEPFIPTTHELTGSELSALLSWYATHCQPEDTQKFFMDHLRSQGIEFTEAGVESFLKYTPTVGFVCRIIARGGRIPTSSLRWVTLKLNEFQSFTPPLACVGNDRPKPEKPKVSVQEHVKDHASRCIGELEQCIDTFILSNFKTLVPPISVMRAHQLKGPQATHVITHFKRFRDEYQLAATSSDPDIREAYSNFTKSQLVKLATYCDRIMSDGLTIVKESLATRAPRTRKAKSPEQIVKSVQYLSAYPDLHLTSIEPAAVVGAAAAWTYNVKTRQLTLHVADDAAGLTFKGTTVYNTNTALSMTKVLRKPEETLREVREGSKTIIKKLMDSLTTKAGTYKNRLNKDTVIVKIHK